VRPSEQHPLACDMELDLIMDMDRLHLFSTESGMAFPAAA